MPEMSATLQPDAALRRALANLEPAARRAAMRDGLEAGARVVETRVKILLSQPGSGNEYQRGSRNHRASAPGDPPAVDLGTLRASIAVDRVTAEEAIIAPHTDYAEYLEFGTRTMAARPYMRPALDDSTDEIYDAFEQVVQELIG